MKCLKSFRVWIFCEFIDSFFVLILDKTKSYGLDSLKHILKSIEMILTSLGLSLLPKAFKDRSRPRVETEMCLGADLSTG